MIIFGSRAVHLVSAKSTNATCPNCDTQGSLVLSIFRKHAHIFWIPMFPIGKKGVSQCQNCKNVLETHEMPQSLATRVNELAEETKGPTWQFAGIGIILALAVMGTYASSKSSELTAEYIASPMAGDVYEYSFEPGSYSTFLVASVSGDSIFVYPNEYEINKITRLYQIEKPENYSTQIIGFSKEDVLEMHASGEIISVER